MSYTEDYFSGRPQIIFKHILALNKIDSISYDLLLDFLNTSHRDYFQREASKIDVEQEDLYFKQLEERYKNKLFRKLSYELYRGDITVDEKYGQIEKVLSDIDQGHDTDIINIPEIALQLSREIEQGKPPQLLTGINTLDNITGGLTPSEYIISAGTTSMGKTALAIQIHINLSISQQLPTAYISLEMSQKQLLQRIITNVAGIPLPKWKTYNFTKEEIKKIKKATDKFKDCNLYIADLKINNISNLQSKMKKLKKQYDVQLITIDYIQLLLSKENKHAELSVISPIIKKMAKDMGIPILVLSQLRRDVSQRDEKRPQLTDLKESGTLENDADMVWLLHRQAYYSKELRRDKVHDFEIDIAKNRLGGELGTAYCKFEMPTQNIM